MRQFAAIASNAFMELIRQPVFLLLTTTSALFAVFLASIPYFGFGDDPKLVKDGVLALMLLAGLLGAVLSASNSVAREIHTGTALAVMAKPVSRAQFLLAKYTGLAGVLVLLCYVNLVAALLATRMAYDAYGSTDWVALSLFCAFVVLAYIAGGFSNFFLRRPFVSDAILSLVVAVTLAFVLINFWDKEWKLQSFGVGVDWRMAQAGLLVLFAVWILAGLALLCSTRLEMVSTLAICSALFLVGLVSDYFFERRAAAGSWWASILYTIVPNWQLFWLAGALDEGKEIPWSYLGRALTYAVAYIGAALAGALWLFEERELT
jgi:ABC-type transport system involved in multi-copper enzyme maturation permease subunit